ncbi:hypothetical protein [Methanocorpusculum vombati]|uniref:Uncharacterized protein n=1 Tax=Methanocorpusculum vombati TaxID=3002864 RepID=A0ABT4IKG1_9EURY|nr:hypothetical protein [Methanocorpusculum vombati]MCZ9320097.1 hypothetical protein [Methanocorpusculum sp.]MCZ0862224.1 hypothetical protein [Methanocorpusculum vombati]MDE2519702.1 hypothetical protein [Methanocorpusculum sp.]MDE2534516.1 hypothetical protein [Methanocorpusculum sp.]MDE2546507.1 hypothetical protein [Methanocorpusculum sp.]
MRFPMIVLLLVVAVLSVAAAGCVSPDTPAEPAPTPVPTATPVPTFSPDGITEEGTLNAAGYGTQEFPRVLMKKGPVTFHATFDGPRTFTLDISLHGAEVEQVFSKRGAFDETVTIDIGSTQYYYVTVTGLGNWTVVQS